MAFLIPDNLKSRPDVPPALRRVASSFQIALDEDVLVWFEPLYDPAGDKPHFVVLLPNRGIVVLEVFDAKAGKILGFLRGKLRFERDGREIEVHSPLKRAEDHAAALRARLAAEPRLRGIEVPVEAGAVFPWMTAEEATEKGLAGVIDPHRCLFRPDVDAGVDGRGETAFLRAFTHMLGGHTLALDERAVDLLRGLIQPSIVIDSLGRKQQAEQLLIFRPPTDGEDTIRVMDQKQEAMAKSLGEGHRVIRGVAGSGKTLILVYRARLVAQANPRKRYLLTCFTKTLASQLEGMLSDLPNITVRNLDGLMSDVIRAGGMKHPGYKGDDPGERVAQAALDALSRSKSRYDGVFVDEAQDFGTTALRFIVALLAEESNDLVIVADAAQNIFRRRFSWKQAGIHAQGRTRILHTNYRNTKEILEFAYGFLTGGSLRSDEVPDMDDESSVIQPKTARRSGPAPVVSLTRDVEEGMSATIEQVMAWLGRDRSPRGIAILYASTHGGIMAEGLLDALEEAGIDYFWATDPQDKGAKLRLATATEPVIISTVYSAKGLEFPHVALCELGRPDDEPEAARKLSYVGMTRATRELFVTAVRTHPLASDLALVPVTEARGPAA